MKKIAIGTSDFKEIINQNRYYIDKTLLIKEIIKDGSKTILLPRPRRFGKTLNMSMLRYFFEKTNENHRYLFKNLKINACKDIMDMQGKYPVIYLTFKDINYFNWEDCMKGIKSIISYVYEEHDYLLKGEFLEERQKEYFNNILNKKGDIVDFAESLKVLSKYLYKYYNEKVVILIDEYDTPIHCGYLNDYYEQVIKFMRNFFSGGLKDNPYLQKSVLTGILRIAKESIFSGLNNLKVCTLIRTDYSDKFGFLENEVEDMLRYYGIEYEMQQVRNWYNGYIFGDNIIYNPWSIINFIDDYEGGLKAHWVNTSSNDLVKIALTKGSEDIKKELEDLIAERELIKEINEDIVMKDIDKDTESIWSFLLFSGYLKVVDKKRKEGKLLCSFKIPNLEVKYLYKDIIISWFKENINNEKFNLMLKSLISGDIKIFGKILKEFVISSVSYFDVSGKESEKVYHAFVLGMLIALSDEYEVKSNRESGYGRYDVMVIPKDISKLGIVIEFKKVDRDDKETLEIAVENAIKQIKDKNYKQELLDRGVKDIIQLGIAFEGKDILVKENSKFGKSHPH